MTADLRRRSATGHPIGCGGALGLCARVGRPVESRCACGLRAGLRAVGARAMEPPAAKAESLLLLAPVTALECVGDRVLAGEGPNLLIYCLETGGQLVVTQFVPSVLCHYYIHGIRELQSPASTQASETTLAIFGSKGLRVLTLSWGEEAVKLTWLSQLCELHDWIWDLHWVQGPGKASSALALALGHNSVVLYDHIRQQVLQEVQCDEMCIIYSACLVGKDWQELVLVAGTVFNQLVIWHPADFTSEKRRVKVERRISGHSGVIFSICYMESKGLLASASDDRSIRVWRVGDLRVPHNLVQCILVCYGHQSRVWSVQLLDNYIISIGEDSACIVWNYIGEIVQTFKGHKGRSIRAVAVHKTQAWVVTGGADSGIRLWPLKGNKLLGSSLLPLSFGSFTKKGSPKALTLVSPSWLLVMTDVGAIYLYDLTVKQWKFILDDINYQSYNLLDAVQLPGGSVICALGNLEGHIKIFPLHYPQEAKELKIYKGKVHGLSWVPRQPWDPGRNDLCCALFASGPEGVLLWLDVSFCPLGRVDKVVEQRRYILPLCKQRWHTCLTFLPQGDFLVCGDRRGSLLLFPCGAATAEPSGEEMGGRESSSSADSDKDHGSDHSLTPEEGAPVDLLFGIHGKQGVTSVTFHRGYVYSTGRDGSFQQLCVQGKRLQPLWKQKPCKGMDWVAGLSFASDGNLLVLGFHSTDFVVWSPRTHEKLHIVPCGGGHRSWGYARTSATMVFACIKAGDVMVYQAQEEGSCYQAVLKESLHGRELTCVRHVGAVRTQEGDNTIDILVTSSEDTTVNILAFVAVSSTVFLLATINNHISSVRTLTLCGANTNGGEPQARLQSLLFSAGGRAEMQCYQLLVTADLSAQAGLTCQVTHLISHRLDELWDRQKNKHKVIKMDPETRYMSIVVVTSAQQSSLGLVLAAACSDGSVRLFLVDESARKLQLLAESFYHQRCVLRIQTVTYEAETGASCVVLCSAATDGSIAFWDITATLDHALMVIKSPGRMQLPCDLGCPCLTIQAHSCGVNSLHIRETCAGQYLVASGSDDGSIHVCLVAVEMPLIPQASSQEDRKLTPKTCVHVIQKFSVVSAHTAHVTGLRVLRPDLLVSASTDQRLTFWSLGPTGLAFVNSRICHVADVSEIDCWTSKSGKGYHCVLSGQGLEIIHWTG
ncbi:tRNA (34-2'-O)-methyltransferase regulator WDR6 isoform X1 [Phascolarctos cinereus]|uniref:tRNA (34-2'-O)-methyltransferase regulator WDR6 n=1 Tax=Phascolarctos cinereus TaxID=38626 RepID=A0A6P5LE57_PHACI|nr:WD repeat-containing protein 6 isoform X1 [Phascolarctos cinereus]